MKFTVWPSLFFFHLFFANVSAQSSGDLLKQSVVVRSIDMQDEDFSDLQVLKEKIGNAGVVVLGEATHADGETEKAKIRMIKFLHREMGFDVLDWEFSFLLDWLVNGEIKRGSRLSKAFWGRTKSLENLWTYAQQSWKTGRPLIFAGFDSNRPPMDSIFGTVLDSLVGFDPSLRLTPQQRLLVDSVSRAINGYLGNRFTSSLNSSNLKSTAAILKNLQQKMRERKTFLLRFMNEDEWKRFYYALESVLIDLASEYPRRVLNDLGEWNRVRDYNMAKRLIWQLTELYPNKKIIIWAATGHLIRNTDRFTEIDTTGFRKEGNPKHWSLRQAGDHLAAFVDTSIYTIAFASYEGQHGDKFLPNSKMKDNISQLDHSPIAGSFEYLAHGTGRNYLFVDLKRASEDSWLKREFVAYPLGYYKDKAIWHKIIDAFFFINTQKPIEY